MTWRHAGPDHTRTVREHDAVLAARTTGQRRTCCANSMEGPGDGTSWYDTSLSIQSSSDAYRSAASKASESAPDMAVRACLAMLGGMLPVSKSSEAGFAVSQIALCTHLPSCSTQVKSGPPATQRNASVCAGLLPDAPPTPSAQSCGADLTETPPDSPRDSTSAPEMAGVWEMSAGPRNLA